MELLENMPLLVAIEWKYFIGFSVGFAAGIGSGLALPSPNAKAACDNSSERIT
ncbi:hypothetical protein [Rubinisphaera sp. JC750]|uniref:hypothetical protein n=1 Tax=Rubinisphaera sp. JC750 TaxID=2898658 RepID=UPI001F18FE59|nr:hypothetical protein [Rubinisphaera sp. JC750]